MDFNSAWNLLLGFKVCTRISFRLGANSEPLLSNRYGAATP